MYTDLVLTNANVVTLDAAKPRAEAMAVKFDRIAQVSAAKVRNLMIELTIVGGKVVYKR